MTDHPIPALLAILRDGGEIAMIQNDEFWFKLRVRTPVGVEHQVESVGSGTLARVAFENAVTRLYHWYFGDERYEADRTKGEPKGDPTMGKLPTSGECRREHCDRARFGGGLFCSQACAEDELTEKHRWCVVSDTFLEEQGLRISAESEIAALKEELEVLVAYSRSLEERNRRLQAENRRLKGRDVAYESVRRWRRRLLEIAPFVEDHVDKEALELQAIANEMAEYLLRSSRE